MMTTRLPAAEMMSAGGNRIPGEEPILLRQISDGEMDAAELPARNLKITRPARATAQHDRVELTPQTGHGQVDADLDAGPELDALGSHEREPPIE